ncbi:hypothetical protein ACFQJC_05100 [Haloferax namakaokahaiae]|uniref:Uncharacterized protein n=1 Tax=Haloferax namakaokahaiae TaxID=1748331 RepID=A0ABD5ZD98_9EURY
MSTTDMSQPVREGWATQLSWPGCDPETVEDYVAAVDDESHLLDILSRLTDGEVSDQDMTKIGHVNARLMEVR